MNEQRPIILIDFELLLRNPKKTLNANNMCPPRQGIRAFLRLLCSKYTLRIYSKSYLAPIYFWCQKYNMTKYFDAVVTVEDDCYLHLQDHIRCRMDINSWLQKICKFTI